MRLSATVLLWVVTTVALAVAVPLAWAKQNIVSADGYAALAEKAATDPALQAAAASELTTEAMTLIEQGGYQVNSSVVREAVAAYTAGSSFPAGFAQANRVAHAWMFARPTAASDPWVIDLSPMLRDTAFQQKLDDNDVSLPSQVDVPLTVAPSKELQPGKLRPLAQWDKPAGIAAVALTGICALLTVVVARSRGRALAALGVSALLAGAAGWAGIEVARRHINHALNQTTGNVRRIADVMLAHAESGLHQWLNLTLAAGGALVVFGVLAAVPRRLWKSG